MTTNTICLSVENLTVNFTGENSFEAIKGISFQLKPCETTALIGQSGSGKSVCSLTIMGLLASNTEVSGAIRLGETDLLTLSEDQWTKIRGKRVGMIFQEPMSALNPIMTCGEQLVESILTHQAISAKEAKQLATDWFDKVQLPNPDALFYKYPHQISGGQKQRVMIAMAMCNHPDVLIADEPTTALDVMVQKDIVVLMQQLQKEYNTAILFITHDMDLAHLLADEVIVMEKGNIIQHQFQLSNLVIPTVIHNANLSPILEVKDLSIVYNDSSILVSKAKEFKAVDNVSFTIHKGETVGLVGGSGCGKSTISKAILGLVPIASGSISFQGNDLGGFTKSMWKAYRKKVQMVFQDPNASLNPRINIGGMLREILTVHKITTSKDSTKQYMQDLMDKVQLPSTALDKYPHEFSGGQKQRLCIARALAVQPELIICDESVAALDTVIQSQILELLQELQAQEQLTYLFITHDLKVVQQICNEVMVMEKGVIVEKGNANTIISNPHHPYTKMLINTML